MLTHSPESISVTTSAPEGPCAFSSLGSSQAPHLNRPGLITCASVLVLCFAKPLYDLFGFCLKTDLFSHILLIPFISAYLVWHAKDTLPRPSSSRSRPLTLSFATLGAVALAAYFALAFSGHTLSEADYLSLTTLSFVSLLLATALWFLGKPLSRALAFPLGFLFFLVPFPDAVTTAVEVGSQHASANAYAWLMDLSQATYFRNGLVFTLPGLTIQVAQECSGIRSSFVLFLTGLLAGHMFLRSPWKKALLALFVFPLGIARNAFRIYLLSMLSAHWDPSIIHSPLHHRGGPIFFVLSLIPFFILLFCLRRSDHAQPRAA